MNSANDRGTIAIVSTPQIFLQLISQDKNNMEISMAPDEPFSYSFLDDEFDKHVSC